ncbi:MAG: DUF4372 domain-containing protein [Bryobacteraceae bacterium]|jgi:hypothetical protein
MLAELFRATDRSPAPLEFQKCATRDDGDHDHRSLSCRDQYLATSFAQFTYGESLRDNSQLEGSSLLSKTEFPEISRQALFQPS